MEEPSLSPSLISSHSAGHPSLPSTMETRSCPAHWALVSGFPQGRAFGDQGLALVRLAVSGGWGGGCRQGAGGKVPVLSPLSLISPPTGECYELQVHCKTSFVGYFPATVLWELLGPGEPGSEGAGTFYIARFLAAVAHSPLAAQLKPTTPFKRTRITGNPVVTSRIEEGERPDR